MALAVAESAIPAAAAAADETLYVTLLRACIAIGQLSRADFVMRTALAHHYVWRIGGSKFSIDRDEWEGREAVCSPKPRWVKGVFACGRGGMRLTGC